MTATDLAPLCGVYPKSALRKYGGLSLRTEYCNEIAVRLLASCLATTAARHNVGIDVVFSHCTDHYVRLYALARHGAMKADESIRKVGYIYHCFTCFRREVNIGAVPPVKLQCSDCGSLLGIAGPLWLGKIVERKFCELIEKEAVSRRYEQRIVKMLSLIKMEADAPATYFVIDKICDKLGVPVPSSKKIIEGLREKGFLALRTHFHTRGIKTNASAETVVQTVKENAE